MATSISSKPFRSDRLRNGKSEYGLGGSNSTCKPNALLRLGNRLQTKILVVQAMRKAKLVLVPDASIRNAARSDSSSLAAS